MDNRIARLRRDQLPREHRASQLRLSQQVFRKLLAHYQARFPNVKIRVVATQPNDTLR